MKNILVLINKLSSNALNEQKHLLNLIIDKNQFKNNNLHGTKIDKRKMIEIFKNKYQYDIICNKLNYCTLKDFENILNKSQFEFKNTNKYDAIIFIYSGHGDKHSLILSDYHNIKIKSQKSNDHSIQYGLFYEYNTVSLTKIESYFNGFKVKEKINQSKLYFIDACRGHVDCNPISYDNLINDGNDDNEKKYSYNIGKYGSFDTFDKLDKSPNNNRFIFYSNTEPFISYDTTENGGILIDALYRTLLNDSVNFDKNFIQIQQKIRKKTDHQSVARKDMNGCIKYGIVQIENKTTMEPRFMQQLYFKKCVERTNQEIIEQQNKINIHHKLNIQYW